MCPGSNITRTSTPVAMSTQPAGSFFLCCFWQVVRHLWSLLVSGILHHTDLHPIRNVNPKSWFFLCVVFDRQYCPWSLHMSSNPITQISTPVGMASLPAGSFCLCCLSQVERHLWSLHIFGIHCHTDLHFSSNVYPAS